MKQTMRCIGISKNVQGDIIAILNSAGNEVVNYTYNAWGLIINASGSLVSTLGYANPFRYRGYYYDTETGYYYLNSRYYDPTTGRFLNADIALSVSGDGGVVYGVKHLLFEVIYNLCDNSIKYTPDGGKVKVDISETEKEVTLTVSDNGIGIAPEHLPRIFERFYRVDKSHSKKSGADTTSARLRQKGGTDAVRHSATGGTGLGLSIVKHSVQYHGGKISIKSEENKGTVITVVLPKSE